MAQQSSHKNSYIPRLLRCLPVLAITLFSIMFIQQKTLYATAEETKNIASSIVDSMGISNQGGTNTILNGVSYQKTGYLCYILTADGQPVPGTQAVALQSPGYRQHDGYIWYCTSRKGGYTATNWSGQAPWNLTPWQSDAKTTNEPAIKSWFKQMGSDGVQNATHFAETMWGTEVAEKFISGDYIIAVETIMHFQYSIASNEADSALQAEIEKIGRLSDMSLMMYIRYINKEDGDKVYQGYVNAPAFHQPAYATSFRTQLITEVTAEYNARGGGGTGRTLVGSPVIGTVPNLIAYANQINTPTKVFDSYLRNTACFAEMIKVGEAGERAGFTAYTGSTASSIRLSDSEVSSYGVALFVISAQNDLVHTYNGVDSPGPSATEPVGTFNIVKNYRTKNETTGAYIDDGCFVTNKVSSNISIDNEPQYQVVGWATSSTTSTIDSTSWPVPSAQRTGDTAGAVQLTAPETCLYVLLEKVEEEPEELKDYNYKLTQSSITRRIWFSNPDNQLSMPKIQDHTFTWQAKAHKTTCSGHTYYTPCQGHGHYPSRCEVTCQDPHTHCYEGCQSDHNCGGNCVSSTDYCTGWKWKETKLKLSINNTQQDNYPDILSTKPDWNQEGEQGKITKHYYKNGQAFDRGAQPNQNTAAQTYTGDNWDYVAVLMRGKDKITLAEWENAGEGVAPATTANEELCQQHKHRQGVIFFAYFL